MLSGDELKLNSESYKIYLPNHTYFYLGQLLQRYKNRSEFNNVFIFENMPSKDEFPFGIHNCHNIRIFEVNTPTCCCFFEIEEFAWGPVLNHKVSWYNHYINPDDYILDSSQYSYK